jgi:hypothetical protein
MQNKQELIYRSVLVILFIVLLAILYRYSENGRYTYHKEITDNGDDKYVVDTRTGTIYGRAYSFFDGNESLSGTLFYKIELQTGKEWYVPRQIIQRPPPKETKPSSSK